MPGVPGGVGARRSSRVLPGDVAGGSGGARGQAHRETVLTVPDDLAGDRCLAAQRTAELADHPLAASAQQVDLLADQRRAAAVRAAAPVGLQRADAAAQQKPLQLLDMTVCERHRVSAFAVPAAAPSRAPAWAGSFVCAGAAAGSLTPGRRLRDRAPATARFHYPERARGCQDCYDRHKIPPARERPLGSCERAEEHIMGSLTSGTVAGAGSFNCERCGYTLTLDANDALSVCPGCGGEEFVRASLFSTERIAAEDGAEDVKAALIEPASPDRAAHLERARTQIEQPGDYLYYEEGNELRTVALTREWTRIGRSLAADVRFDDPTVSRRHALIVRHPDGVRLLDDRSLNGVFVNGARVDGKVLQDGDEIIVGRYRLSFVRVAAQARSGDTGQPPARSVG